MLVKTPLGSFIDSDSFEAFLCEFSPQDNWYYIRAYLRGSFHDWEKSYVIGKGYTSREEAFIVLDEWIKSIK